VRPKPSSPKRLGVFTIAPEIRLHGELRLKGPRTRLYLHDTAFFPTQQIASHGVKGVLHNLTKVSMIGCIAPPLPAQVTQGDEQYYYASIFPHFILLGDSHVSADEKRIAAVDFLIDDATALFHDHDAFGWMIDASSVIDQIANTMGNMSGRQIPTGPGAQVAYFIGNHEIFAVNTVFGNISASHHPVPMVAGPDGVHLKNRIYVSVVFPKETDFQDAIFRTYRLIEFLGLVVGRPQNLLDLHLRVTTDHEAPTTLKVCCSMPPKRSSSGECEKPSAFDVLLDAVGKPKEFSSVLERWLERQKDWNAARWRFFECFGQQRHYMIDRLVASANMFDILPDSALPDNLPLTEEQKAAQSSARCLFRALPPSPERDSVLGALGRLGKSSLKHKIRHRAQRLLDSFGERFSQLLIVTDEAVNCRNYFVHGNDPRFDYEKNSDLVTFFTDTLEFVFATSDLIDAGWDAQSWISAPTSMSHPFGRYRVNYPAGLQRLKTVLSERTAAAPQSGTSKAS
jgi:hypothetical protein